MKDFDNGVVKKAKPTAKMLRKKTEKDLDKLWSAVVRKRWGNYCAGCGKPGNQAHHFFHRAAGSYARWSAENGILLCFGCHIRKVHQRGDVEPIREALIKKIGQEEFDRLKVAVKRVWKPTLPELQALLERLEVD